MRRTTISRSELTVLGVLLAAVAGSAQAQQPPAIQRPINQAQRAAGQAGQSANQANQADQQPAPRRAEISSGNVITEQAQTPTTHTVAQGETLWSLAQQYLGDPMLWPEIYRLNTNVIEDPHWIYPGEELRLSPEAGPPPAATDSTVLVQQSVNAQPAADTVSVQQGPVAPMAGPTIFSTSAATPRRTQTFDVAAQRAYRAVREGEYFSSGFLTEGQPLNSGRILANAQTRLVGEERTRASAMAWETLIIEPPPGDSVKAGDLLLAFRRGDEVGTYGEIIHPTGMLKVLRPAGARWAAQVVRVYAPVEQQQELLKVQPFVSNSSRRAEPVTGGVEGHVLASRDGFQVSQMQSVFFIDKGANDGVRLGDIFQLYVARQDRERGSVVEQDQARGLVVSTRASTATIVIVELYRTDVGTLSQVRQVRRMPS